MQRYHTILFDFDGTLADTQPLALEIMNILAPEFGMRPIASEEIPALKQLSAWQLLVQRSGIPLWRIFKLRRLERRVREEFLARSERIALFPGIADTLRKVQEMGYEVGIVSSNSRLVVAGALERAGVSVHFMHTGSRFFGKAYAIQKALREYSIGRAGVLYVGDELRDVEACKKVRIPMVAVGWGFNAPEALRASGALVASTPEELLRMLSA
jgi:phosphoglycolate phosphatase